jgi:hypothetical protein
MQSVSPNRLAKSSRAWMPHPSFTDQKQIFADFMAQCADGVVQA